MHDTIGKFTKEVEKWDIILGNQRGTYNKEVFVYQPKMYEKPFKK